MGEKIERLQIVMQEEPLVMRPIAGERLLIHINKGYFEGQYSENEMGGIWLIYKDGEVFFDDEILCWGYMTEIFPI